LQCNCLTLNTDTKKRHPPAKKNGALGTLVTTSGKNMVQPIHSREQLEKFSILELRAECDKLSIPRRRSRENCINDILATQPQLVAELESEQQTDDYLFHDDQQPANLPVVGDTHFIGGFLLRCAQVNSEYAVVWDVLDEKNVVMGEIRMGWDCNWCHTMSLDTFATPQEAVVDLRRSLSALVEEDEAVAFDKVADGRWQSNVNGVLVRITLEGSGYKCNLVDTVFADYELAIKESLLAVARVQEQRGLGVSPTKRQ
jgi:hypothetical protein